MNRLHASENKFDGGYYAFFCPSMRMEPVSDMNFHSTNSREMGFLFDGLLRQGPRDMALKQSELVPSVIEGMNCEQEVVEKVSRDPGCDPQENRILNTSFPHVHTYIGGIFISTLTLIVELVIGFSTVDQG